MPSQVVRLVSASSSWRSQPSPVEGCTGRRRWLGASAAGSADRRRRSHGRVGRRGWWRRWRRGRPRWGAAGQRGCRGRLGIDLAAERGQSFVRGRGS